MREQLFKAIHNYAKRQRTWFKRNKQIHWLTPDKNEEALGLAKSFSA
jgi:tRNA A37 N6-isopentenylltransferase MiaA